MRSDESEAAMASASKVQVWIDRDYERGVRSLAKLLKTVAPHVEPIDSLEGMVSQIDNYIAGLRNDCGNCGDSGAVRVGDDEYQACPCANDKPRGFWCLFNEKGQCLDLIEGEPSERTKTGYVWIQEVDENADIYRQACESMAKQFVCPKVTGLQLAKMQLGEK